MSRTSPEVSIVIVAHNELRILRRCLGALFAQSVLPTEVVVVDNASSDGTSAWLRRTYPSVTVVCNDTDVGFCIAANTGLQLTHGDFVLNLSPDVTLAPAYLETLLKVFDGQPDVGICAGKLVRADQTGNTLVPTEIDSAGHLPRRTGVVDERGHGEIDHGQFDVDEDLFGVAAAAALFRRATIRDLESVGHVFDPTFWGYKDDIDVCWRAWHLGWRVRYVYAATASHVRGFGRTRLSLRRARQLSYERRFHSFRNRYFVLMHNWRLLDLARSLPWFFWYEFRAGLYVLIVERDLVGAYVSTIRLAPQALRTRFKLKRVSRVEWTPWSRFAE